MKPVSFLAIALFYLPSFAGDEQTVTVTSTSIQENDVIVKADLQGKATDFFCSIGIPSCFKPPLGKYRMVRASAAEGVYEDCTNIVLYKPSDDVTERIGVYCWTGSGDCYISACGQTEILPLPGTSHAVVLAAPGVELVPQPERKSTTAAKEERLRGALSTGGGATVYTNSALPGAPDECSEADKGDTGQFNVRFPWYVRGIPSKVREKWLVSEVDPRVRSATRVCLTFEINRTGEPGNIRIKKSSGVSSLDESALRAVKRVSSFGPLPPEYQPDKVSVLFWFDYKPRRIE